MARLEESTEEEPSQPQERSREIPIIIENTAVNQEEKGWPLESVIAFVAAVCLAHFLIVSGGWTTWVVQWLEEIGIRQA